MEVYNLIHRERTCKFSKEEFEKLCKPYRVKIVETSIKLAKNRELRNMVILALAIGLTYQTPVVAAYADPFSAIDKAGFQLLRAVQRLAYWACLISGITGVIEYAMKHDVRGKEKAFGSIMCFIAVFLLPKVFDMIKGIF